MIYSQIILAVLPNKKEGGRYLRTGWHAFCLEYHRTSALNQRQAVHPIVKGMHPMQLSEQRSDRAAGNQQINRPMKIQTREKPSRCPWCGSQKIAFMLRGMPVFFPDLEHILDGGGLVIGSRKAGQEGPTWQCTECYAQFYRDVPEEN